MSGIREEFLKTDKDNVKVSFFGGGTIEDMEDNIKHILEREPNCIILHIGTNNATNLTAIDILDKLLWLKSTILDARKSCKVLILQPTWHSDNGKAALTNHQICNLLEELNIDVFKNRNIGSKQIGSKGLHLNPHGTARLALNLKATIRKLWSKFDNLGNIGYQINVASVSSYHNKIQNLNHCSKNQHGKSTIYFPEANAESCENGNRSNATGT